MSDLPAQYESFVSAYMHDSNGARAAIAAGFKPRAAARTAVRLLARPEIAAEIAKRQAEVAQVASVSLQSLLIEAEEARKTAEKNDQASAMVSATNLKARLLGLIDSPMDAAERERVEAIQTQAGALKTAAQLLADAAVSLGLSATASPAEIVGAGAECAIWPPELYALFHERAKATDAN